MEQVLQSIFTVGDDNGKLYLRQQAEFNRKWYAPAYGLTAGILWYAQAKRLVHLIRKEEKLNRT